MAVRNDTEISFYCVFLFDDHETFIHFNLDVQHVVNENIEAILFEFQDHNVNDMQNTMNQLGSSGGSVLPDFTELELTSVTREAGI